LFDWEEVEQVDDVVDDCDSFRVDDAAVVSSPLLLETVATTGSCGVGIAIGDSDFDVLDMLF